MATADTTGVRFGYAFIWVEDVAGAAAFYERAFGLRRRTLRSALHLRRRALGSPALGRPLRGSPLRSALLLLGRLLGAVLALGHHVVLGAGGLLLLVLAELLDEAVERLLLAP